MYTKDENGKWSGVQSPTFGVSGDGDGTSTLDVGPIRVDGLGFGPGGSTEGM